MPPKTAALQSESPWARACDRVLGVLLDLTYLATPLVFIILTRDQFELPKLTVLRILTAAMLGLWALRVLAVQRLELRSTPLDVPLGVWFGLQVLTTLHSISPWVSWLGEYENFRGLLTVGNYYALFYLLVNFVRTRAQIDRLLLMTLLAGLLTTAYGISQFFGVDFIAWNPTSVAKGRYFSTLGNPNFLAAYLAMVMPLIVVFFIETRSRFRRTLLFISFVAMFLCLLGTGSRGGFLALLGALGVLVGFGVSNALRYYRGRAATENLSLTRLLGREIVRHKLWVGFLAGVAVLLVVLSVTLGTSHMARVTDSVVHFKDAIRVSRLHIWGPAMNMFRERPVLGLGLDTFKTAFPRYATPEFAAIDGSNVASRTAHNEVLQVLTTQGLVGLAIVTWLTVMILIAWATAYRACRDSWRDRLILYGLLASWAAYSLQNLFSFGVVAIDTFYWLILAVIVLLQTPSEDQERLAPSRVPAAVPGPVFAALAPYRPFLAVVVSAAAVFLGYKAWAIALADFAFNRASFYRMQELWDPAAKDFAWAARLAPCEVKYVVYEGLAYEEKAKGSADPAARKQLLDQAIAAYQRGVRMNPTNAYYLGNLGRAYALAAELDPASTEAYPLAVKYYRQAIAQGSVTVLFYQNLGILFLNRDDEDSFLGLEKQLSAFDPIEGARLDFTAGNHYYGLGDLARADRYYSLALERNPGYIEALFNLGVTRTQLTGPKAGLPLWRQALELKPDFEPARQMIQRYTGSRSGAGAGDILVPAPR